MGRLSRYAAPAALAALLAIIGGALATPLARADDDPPATAAVETPATARPTDPPAATAEPPAATAEPTAEQPAATAEPTAEPPAPPTAPPAAPIVQPSPTAAIESGGPPVGSGGDPIGEAPLTIAQRISVDQAAPGAQVQYIVQIASARPGALAESRSFLPAELDVVSVAVSGGSCSGTGPVVCRLTFSDAGGAVIVITARVTERARPGALLVGQTLVQDDMSYTAATEQVSLTVLGTDAASAGSQGGPLAQAATATPIVSDEGGTPAPTRTRVPSPTAQPTVAATAVTTATAAVEATAPAQPTEAAAAAAEATPADQGALAPALPQAKPTAEPAQGAQTKAASLPDTAESGPLLAVGLGLLGLALAATATRRVRFAALRLDQQPIVDSLAPLIGALASLQRRTARGADEFGAQVERLSRLADRDEDRRR